MGKPFGKSLGVIGIQPARSHEGTAGTEKHVETTD
jgi:hypothetical protein